MTRGSTKTGALLVAVLLLAAGAALAGPWLADDPTSTVTVSFAAPGGDLPLGSDRLGRDVADRVLAGGASLLVVTAVATVVAVTVGVVLGFVLCSGNRAVRVLGFLLDLLLLLPALLTVMVLVFGLGAGVVTMVVAATVVTAPFVARYTRSLVAPLMHADFVAAARLAGDDGATVAAREIVPNLWLPLLTDAGARFVGILYLVAAAGFLGFDPLGGDGDWATMVQNGLEGIHLNPWATAAPALAIATITIPANLLVDRVGKVGAL